MRRWIAIVGAVSLVAVACSGSSTADTTTTTAAVTTTAPVDITVTASDGSASLLVPASSAGEAITIVPDPTPVTGPAVDALVAAGFEPGPVYLLGPEGLTFSEPLILQIPAPDDGRLVAAFLVGDGTLEPLEPADGEGTDGVAFAVPHFSRVVVFFGAFFASLTAPPQAEVGMPFTVRSQIQQLKAPTDDTGGFQVGGSLIAVPPVNPPLTAAPPLTATALPVFTSVYSLTCEEPGVAQIYHGVQTSVARSQLTPDAAALYSGTSDVLHASGLVSTQVECVGADTVDVDTGVFAGSLQITGIPGWPGVSYQNEYTLELRECGDVVLTQRGTQVTEGHFYKTLTSESDGFTITTVPEENYYSAYTQAEKNDYGEAYELQVVVDREIARITGVSAGGGHGFGSKLTALESAAVAIWADLGHEPLESLDVGWVGSIEGTLDRTGDAAPCE